MMGDHVSSWGEDDDGWLTVTCSCGWGRGAVWPAAEDAGDAWGDHMYDIGRSAGAAEVLALSEPVPPDRLNPWHTLTVAEISWHLAHPITCDLAACPFDAVARQWPGPPLPAGTYQWDEPDLAPHRRAES